MTATQTVKVEFGDQVVERRWSDANEKMDWTPFPVGYGILLNERYQFPMDMALVRAKLDTRRQLFVDNHMIAHMQGVLRETHATKDHPSNPVFAPYKLYPTFIYPDPEHGYRLYYNAGFLQHVAYSKDAVNWERPELNQTTDWNDPENFAGGPNNVVGFGQICGLMHMADDPNSDKRWKMIAKPFNGNNVCPAEKVRHKPFPYLQLPQNGKGRSGTPYVLYTSADGYRWRFEAQTNHWMGPYPDVDAPHHWPLGGSDVFLVRWDPILKKYIGNTKHRIGPDHRFSPIFHAARVVGQVKSNDLIHWSPPRIIAYPDAEDANQPLGAMHGIYEADGYPYESMWLSNFSMSNYTPASKRQRIEKNLIPNRPYIKRNWLRLAASRDGRHWYYFGDRKPFIDLGP